MTKRARGEDLFDVVNAGVSLSEDTTWVRSRVLNAFGGPGLQQGIQLELSGALQLAMSEYAVTHATPTSFIAQKDTDDGDREDPHELFTRTDRSGATSTGTAGGTTEPSTKMTLGLGATAIAFEDRTFVLTRQGFGPPKPGRGMHTSMVLSHEENSTEVKDALKRLCNAALAAYEAARPGKIALYSFVKYGPGDANWQRDRLLLKRPLESVILPADAKAHVTDDVRRFLDAETRAWCASACGPRCAARARPCHARRASSSIPLVPR